MADEEKKLRLEIAHILFIDIVGYSKLLVDEQHEQIRRLNEIVRATDEFRSAEEKRELIRLPTGDGMALVFLADPEAPVRCAVEIAKALNSDLKLQLRMGIHSGPVNQVSDVNERVNVAGAGINMAQRVMDCGDAGHILLSKRSADDLSQYRQWQPHLHDLGECEVKHGSKLGLVSYFDGDAGNPNRPQKCAPTAIDSAPQSRSAHRGGVPRWSIVAASLLVLTIVGTGVWMLARSRTQPSVKAGTILPADTTQGKGVGEKSIAVLPFQNLSKDEENAFFADGVQDQILTDLAKIADLKVISRTSVMQYKNVAVRNLREIATQLGVAHVLEGSVQRAGGKVRVTAQLINALTDAHEWAENYDRPVDDVFAIQSEIAKKIADQLQATISPREKEAMSQTPTTDLVANKLYLQAKDLLHVFGNDPNGKQGLLGAVRLLDEAVVHDPHFLLAYCLVARMNLELYWEGFDHTPARRELANTAIQIASRLQPDGGEVHLARADYAYHGFRDYDGARAELEHARSVLPNDAEIYDLTALIDRRQGRWAEAMRNLERAVELDPLNFGFVSDAGTTAAAARRYPDAARYFERAIQISPRDYAIRTFLALNSLHERADPRPLHALISRVLTEEPAAAQKIPSALFTSALVERDSAAMTRAMAFIPPEGMQIQGGNFPSPREMILGIVSRAFNDTAAAQSSFSAARLVAEKIVHEQPDYAPAWAALGLIDAGLGRKQEAVNEGRRACELLPLSRDAVAGPNFITNLAAIHAWTGEKDAALEQLSISANISNGVTFGDAKLDPRWDSLRGDPRFEKIVSDLKPNDLK